VKDKVMEAMKMEEGDLDPLDVDILRDIDIFRFLKARNYDVEVAFELLLNTLRWRKQVNIRNITVDQVKTELIKGKVIVPGYDKEKRLIILVSGRLHFPSTSNKETMEKLVLFFVEKCRTLVHPESEKINLVFDLSGFGFPNMDYNLVTLLLKIFTEYYPETLGIALVVNSPWIFPTIWNVVKNWMDPNTSATTKFIQKDQIFDYIDQDQLPEDLGGTKNIVNYGLKYEKKVENFS